MVWNTTILSDNTTYDNTYNQKNNELLSICKKKSQIYSMSFIGELVLLYGIFVNYISCIKKTAFANTMLYISIAFYMLTIVIVFVIIQYNKCLEYYKDNTGTHVFYNLLMIQYISCTTIFSLLAFDYIILIFIKYYTQHRYQRQNHHNQINNDSSDDELLDGI